MKRQTSETAIAPAVKAAVAERDSFDGWPCCIYCGTPAPYQNPQAFSNAHYIPRSLGGRGTEENTLTLCPRCHYKFDRTESREKMKAFFIRYLRSRYPGWDETKLIYRKE